MNPDLELLQMIRGVIRDCRQELAATNVAMGKVSGWRLHVLMRVRETLIEDLNVWLDRYRAILKQRSL